ncbi:hypothetical protein F4813DRAFT_393577 [Daldinia decipiens]|uniref:uncharacterized protein n=1 Tax=Daldinia decipiens TaxID=326647 RepID=UPI0020C53B01|nr:uncharacterized protein F4813DRAFT_393577 [Daldinia decipiens]KAI1653542.1 hypothetical protein F4813DRAFT_393577 [Daldinia decipiens]
MAATKGEELISMNMLLDEHGYDQACIRDNEGKTPFLVAIEDNNLAGAHILLDHMPDEKKCMQQSILEALTKNREIFDEALLWVAANFERHKIAKKLLIQNTDLETNTSSVIELASRQKFPDALW